MSTKKWLGGAKAVAQVTTLTPGGTIEADDRFLVTIGSRTLNVAAGGTTVSAVCDAIVAAWATAGPEFDEITCADSTTCVTLTAKTAGVPFVVSLSTTEAGGGAADDQTFVQATTTANAGPNDWSTAGNWTGGAVPVNSDDVVIEGNAQAIYYGLDQSAVSLASLKIKASFTGFIGLPVWNTAGYSEYRERYLKIGATVIDLGDGDGDGAYRLNIDAYTVQTAVRVRKTRTTRYDAAVPIVLLKGTHASNTLTVDRGDVGVAVYGGETATIATLTMTDPGTAASVWCGSGATLTTIVKLGGRLAIASAATTITQYAGSLVTDGSGAVTTLTAEAGTVDYRSSGTITTLTLGAGAKFDLSQAPSALTVTTAVAYPGSEINDPRGLATWTNPIQVPRGHLGQVRFNLGTNKKYTVAAI